MNEPAAFSPDALENADEAQSSHSTLPQHDLRAALHEVSNALTVVVGWLARAQAQKPESESIAGALDIAKKRAEQARGIIRRAIGADIQPEPPCTIASIVRDAMLGLEPEASVKNVVIHSQIKDDLDSEPLFRGTAVLQILTNLLLNALAASPEGAPIKIEIERAGPDAVLFGVSDLGPGIAEERRKTLFDAGKTTRAGGAGIGLRHAAALARDARGELRLAQTARGARFELRWPHKKAVASKARETSETNETNETKEAAAATAPQESTSPNTLSKCRILLVEDDDAIIELLDTVLCGRGATLVTVNNSAALKNTLASNPGAFNAALVDLSPITGDIAGAFAAMHKANPGIRVFFITGSASPLPSLPQSAHAAWIRKPFDVSEIITALTAPSASPDEIK